MKSKSKHKILIVTGISGAGRSSALKILEDMGFEAIDNLPTNLLGKLIDSEEKRNLAVGIDARSRDFDPKKVAKCIESLKNSCSLPVTIKHRIGVDDDDSLINLNNFVRDVANAGADRFTVHARKAIKRSQSKTKQDYSST